MKKMLDKNDIYTPVIFLFFFSFMLGVEINFLNESLSAHRSIIINEPILSVGNLFWLYLVAVLLFLSFRIRITLLRITYFVGGISLIFTPTVINYLGYKGLYYYKIVLLLIACLACMKYITEVLKGN